MGTVKLATACRRERYRRIVLRDQTKSICLVQVQIAEIGSANARRVLQHSVENRLQFAWRRTDDAQHIRSGRLLLKRLPQFAKQSRVLDGDNGLGGEALNQGDLFFGEWPNFLAINRKCADKLVVLEHRNGNVRTSAAKLGRRGLMLFGRCVNSVDHLFSLQKAIEDDTALRHK